MNLRLRFSGLLACLLLLSGNHAGAARRDLPSYELDEPTDRFVSRARPDIDAKAFRMGELGVLLPTFDRESLFLAYRALSLGTDALRRQAAAAKPAALEPEPEDGIRVWLDARRAFTDRAPETAPSAYRDFGGGRIGGFLNCTSGGFVLAAQTLQSIGRDPKFGKSEVQEWLAGQDAVFASCAAAPEASPALPRSLDAKTPAPLRQLRQYQMAAAHFYAGRFDEALVQFDAIAADKKHPMRPWAAHAAMRTILRKASLDDSLRSRLNEIRQTQQPVEQLKSAMASAVRSDESRLEAARAKIVARATAILADKSLETVHQPAAKLKHQATMRLTPAIAYADLSGALGRFDSDAAVSGELDDWVRLGDKLFDTRGRLDLIQQLRGKHEYFDWIRSIQACTDNPSSPNYTGRCGQEHAHALELWKASKRNTWLLAALVTAPRYAPDLDAVVVAAKQIGPQAMEYPSVRYHLVRLLRASGRHDEARALLEDSKTAATTSVSAANLFAQEAFALSRNEDEALPHLLRQYYGFRPNPNRRTQPPLGLGADGDEMINRRMASEDLLRLAAKPAVSADLRRQLLVAAWWRADMTGNAALAQTAARQAGEAVPALRDTANSYLQAADAEARHLVLAKGALQYRISPQVGHVPSQAFASRRQAPTADWWCSFASDDFVDEVRIQRTPAESPHLAAASAQAAGELKALAQIGTGADWLARVAQNQQGLQPQDPALRPMLQAVAASSGQACISPDSDRLVAEAKRLLGTLPGPAAIPEEALRAEYDRLVNAMGNREYRVSHILVKGEAEAREALAAVQAGTATFEDLARQKSLDPGSRPKGGDLGWASPSIFVEPFAAALRSTSAPGLVPAPVKTVFGWHLIRVVDIRRSEPPPFERVRASLEERLRKRQAGQ